MGASPDPLAELARITPFDRVEPTTLEVVRDDLAWRAVPAGQVVLREGTDADELAIVVDGSLSVRVGGADHGGREVARLGPGAVVGEVSVLLGGARTASVVALTDTHVIGLSAAGLVRLREAAPSVAEALTEEATRRLRRTQVTRHLIALLGDLIAEEVIDEVVDAVRFVPLQAGETLYQVGGRADGAYIVLSGRVRVERMEFGGGESSIAEVGRGALLGEGALMGAGASSATATAVRDSVLACLDRSAFDAIAERRPVAMLAVARAITAGLVQGDGGPRRTGRDSISVALLAQSPDVELRLFATRLVEALQRLGPTLHLWSARVDGLLAVPGIAQSGRGQAGDPHLTHWMAEAEEDHQFLVLEVDPTWNAWSQRAVRQADEVIVVGSAECEDVAPGPLESALMSSFEDGGAPRQSLVLLHRASSERPVATARWLEPRGTERQYHVRHGREADIDRLARILAGAATSLVLGGGGARGGAHLGVIRAMRELGVPIDLVGGSSIGAIMAAVAALEWPNETMVDQVATFFTGLLDYTLPIVSVLKGEAITRAIDEAAGDRDIEDLWLPFFCISTNLTRAEEVVHRRGPLAKALRASVAIPGVLPPVVHDGDLLIDGGSINNLPIDRMRELAPTGTLIAVDVAPPTGPRAKEEFRPEISGWGVLASRLRPGAKPPPVPGITMTLLASTIVGAMRDRNRHIANGVADLYLDLDLRGCGLLDFDAIAESAERGYEVALPRLETWLAARAEGG